jgi:hypothetical protein
MENKFEFKTFLNTAGTAGLIIIASVLLLLDIFIFFGR